MSPSIDMRVLMVAQMGVDLNFLNRLQTSSTGHGPWYCWWCCCWWFWWWVVLVMVLLMVAMVVLLLVVMGGNGVVDGVGHGGDGICDGCWSCWWWCKFLDLYLKWVGWANQSHGSVQKLLVKRKRRVGWGSISGTRCMQVCNHQPALVWRQKILCWVMKFVGAVTYSEWVRNPASEPSNSSPSHYCNYMHG